MYSFAPLKTMVQAFEFLHPSKNTKSLSPTAFSLTNSQSPRFFESNTYSPYGVAMVVITVAPVNFAILYKSALSTLLNPNTPDAFMYWDAVSSMPMLVRMTFAPDWIIFCNLLLRTSIYLFLMS
jgi:hypothetical protein